MLLPAGAKVFSDCGLVVDPGPEELGEIAAQSCKTARAFGILPKMAMLSYATGDAEKGALTDKVKEAVKIAKKLAPEELIEGPIQYDAAVNPSVAAQKFKGKDNPVAGKA